MIFLFLGILSSSSIALIFKYTETSNRNRYAITTANYFMATVISIIMIVSSGLIKNLRVDSVQSLYYKLGIAIKTGGKLGWSGSITWGMLTGVIAGIIFFLAFIYYQKSVNKDGVGLAGTFMKLGILVPMILAIILWKELPTKIQWAGIIIAIISIILVNIRFNKKFWKDFHSTLILLFLFGGLAEFSNKIYQKYGQQEVKTVFLFFIFFTAFIISLIYLKIKKEPATKSDFLLGFLVGVPNLFSSFFLILALEQLKASVVFPIYSAGCILIIILGGWILFKEKITLKNLIAVLMIIIALILVNL